MSGEMRFDILIRDIYCDSDYGSVDSTENLTLQEVLDWLCHGGDWGFLVVAHGDPTQLFMSGHIYHDNPLKEVIDG